MRMELSTSNATEVTQGINPLYADNATQSTIADFPTTGQPVLDNTMKEMLLSLQSSLFANFSSLMHKFSSDLHEMGDREIYVESKRGDALTP